ncbi:outer membrane protein TolC [Chitinophaga skermanii]|uniref:Outer membrane protein TolC n=1 Tax=Chitinophaga skermanii TaxID=331697 RepID=A0A327QD35_9BACT|nr:TolC family protein [Chitinophaga skermanii]RAJ01552.1 outer membrane protein TolC [Chitinophaga skermanii]
MKRLKFSFILLIGFGLTTAATAQTKLSLQETLQFALKRNQQLQQVRLEEDLGRLKTKEIRAQALPQISGSGNLTDNILKQKMALPGDLAGKPGELVVLTAGTTWNASLAGDLSQQIYNQSVWTGLKAAKAGEQYYALQTAQSEENVIYNISSLYFNVLVTNQKIAVLESNIEKFKKLTETTQTQFDNGLAKKIDLDRIKVSLTNYTSQRNTLVNQVQVQTNMLKFAIGMPASEQITFPELSLKDIQQQTAGNIDWGNFDTNNRTEFKLIEKQEELQQFQRKAYLAEYYPTVSLNGRYSYNGMSDKFDLFNGKGGSAFWYGMANISLNVKIPIFDGFARKSRVQQSEVKLKQLEFEKDRTKNDLTTSFENAKLQLANNLNTIKAQKENMELAEEVYASTKNNYELGLANLTDLLNAETSLAEAQNSYNEALLQFKLAELELIKSNGNLKTLLN